MYNYYYNGYMDAETKSYSGEDCVQSQTVHKSVLHNRNNM
jgi:hypothetical protein